MNKLTLSLGVSLAANVALVALVLGRLPPRHEPVTPTVPAVSSAMITPASLDSRQLSALQSGDAQALTAAGFPPEVARQIVVGRAHIRLQEQLKTLKQSIVVDPKYWRGFGGWFRPAGKETRAKFAAIQREYTEALAAANAGHEMSGDLFDPNATYLPPGKAELIRRIQQDYAEMTSEVYMESAGLSLPSDQKRIAMLEAEQRRDIAAALTPEELEQYDLRVSRSAQTVRSMYGDALDSEADFKKIVALQKAYDDRYNGPGFYASGPVSAEAMQQRQKASQQLQVDIRAALGESAYEKIQRAMDQDYRMLTGMEKRLGLPAGTPDEVMRARDRYATLSQAIGNDVSLSANDRKQRLQALAQQARTELQKTLGAEGAQVYDERSNWLSLLKGGNAFSTDIKNAPRDLANSGMSVFPVSPKAETPSGKADPASAPRG